MSVYKNNAETVGFTPLVRLNNLSSSNIWAKIESRNPSNSVKCRIGVSMIEDAEKTGALRQGIEIVEPTSGNTGIALAYVAAAKGYALTIVMPETMSIERRRLMTILGAKLVLTPGAEGMKGAIKKAEDILAADPNRYFMPQQFKNPSNPKAHEETTGPEIWADTNGEIDIFVSGVGTGGTITGVSRYIKNIKGKKILSVAVEPRESPVLSQFLASEPLKPSPHRIQGIGAGFVPDILDLSLVDRVETVDSDEAILFARRLAKEEGILAGISAGAAVAVAVRLAAIKEHFGKNIVVLLPDSAERYLTTTLFENLDA